MRDLDEGFRALYRFHPHFLLFLFSSESDSAKVNSVFLTFFFCLSLSPLQPVGHLSSASVCSGGCPCSNSSCSTKPLGVYENAVLRRPPLSLGDCHVRHFLLGRVLIPSVCRVCLGISHVLGHHCVIITHGDYLCSHVTFPCCCFYPRACKGRRLDVFFVCLLLFNPAPF